MDTTDRNAKKRAFLAAYREAGTIRGALSATGISSSTHYKWLSDSEEYQKDFEKAQRASVVALEEEARRRAIEGVAEPIFGKNGEQVGTKMRYSDTMLIFLLKANHPSKFGDKLEQTNKGTTTAPIQVYLPENNRTRNILSESNGSNGHTNGSH